MRCKCQLLLVIVCAALGLVTGALLEKRTARIRSAVNPERTVYAKGDNFQPPDTSNLAIFKAKSNLMAPGVGKWLHWMEAFEKAGLSDFPTLANQAEGNATLLKILSTRWIETNPRSLYYLLVISRESLPPSFVNDLLTEWPKHDLAGVVAALRETNYLSGARERVSTDLINSDVERALELMTEWHVKSLSLERSKISEWAAVNPAHAAEFATKRPIGRASEQIMEIIGKEWALQDPVAALRFASLNKDELSDKLAKSVMREWPPSRASEVSQWLNAADEKTRESFSPLFVEAWSKQDPAAALVWCSSRLSGTPLTDAVCAVVRSVTEKNLQDGLGLVNKMDPSATKAKAATVVALKWMESTSGSPVQPLPWEATGWIAALDTESQKSVIDTTHWVWAERDPKSLSQILSNMKGASVTPEVYSSLARAMIRQDPLGAMKWTGGLENGQSSIASTLAFSEWRSSQPAAAMQWLSAFPENDSRRGPLYKLAIARLANDPRGSEELANWSARDKEAARVWVEGLPSVASAKTRMLEILKAK